MLHDGLGLAGGVPLHVLLQQLLGLPVPEISFHDGFSKRFCVFSVAAFFSSKITISIQIVLYISKYI